MSGDTFDVDKVIKNISVDKIIKVNFIICIFNLMKWLMVFLLLFCYCIIYRILTHTEANTDQTYLYLDPFAAKIPSFVHKRDTVICR